jgi:hypothetical protein
MYIGTKLINAEPMTRAAYNVFRGWILPTDERGEDDGYLVEYLDGGTPNVPGRAGYVSWSPKAQFDNTYRPVTAMTFGLAIEALKRGQKVARAGWNGKGMWLAIQTGSTITPEQARGGAAKGRADEGATEITILPHIDIRAADGSVVVGWLASQTDMLAEDWQIVD